MDGEECIFGVNSINISLTGDEGVCEYEGSTIYTVLKLEDYKEHLKNLREFEKDPNKVREDYKKSHIEKYGRSPFYNYDSEQRWSPTYYSEEELIERIEKAENFLNNPKSKKMLADFQEIRDFINSINDLMMKELFGDHVKIILSVDGVEIEEYEHD